MPLLGARKTDQFKDNLGCLDVQISPETMQTLDEVYQTELGFPHDFLHGDFVQQHVLGGKSELLDGISPRSESFYVLHGMVRPSLMAFLTVPFIYEDKGL